VTEVIYPDRQCGVTSVGWE